MNALASLLLASTDAGGVWLPPQASEQAADVDWLFWFIFYLCTFFFVLIVALAGYFSWAYRRRTPDQPPLPSAEHNTPLEVFWSVVPLVLVIYIFYVGFTGFMHLYSPPPGAYTIDVTAQKWSWAFRYPDGRTPLDGNLHVPPGEPIRLVMSSQDVLHSLFVPAFRVKQDLVPGRYTTLWFTAKPPAGTEPVEYLLTCTEYCGTGHSDMMRMVVVHPTRASFEEWLAKQDDVPPTAEVGERIYRQLCVACHNITGPVGQGPNFGETAQLLRAGGPRTMADGAAVVVDEEYIRESIMEPQARIVSGFQPVMPTFKGQLKEPHIGALIAYLRTLGE
ncbi:MAG: cytochrome c oxidase subunit II [Planctomycetes bacterium]|nr:cytochrome c oxidase subunit II [Planctomycetota bacterium]